MPGPRHRRGEDAPQDRRRGEATSGTASLDLSTPRFKDDLENAMRELASGLISAEEFTKKVDVAADKASRR
jgi:hypothetical protein